MAKTKNVWAGIQKVLGGNENPLSLDKYDVKGLISGNTNNEQSTKKFNNIEDYRSTLLSLQQQKFLDNQYKKVSNDTYQKSVYYNSNRYSAYIDFEQMEYFPEIATALNIMSEEATTLFEDGKMLRIESSSNRIKNILTDLFENKLQINTSLPYWTRSTCKYGDTFLYLKTEKNKGISKVVQMKNLEMHRKEGDPITGDGNPKFTWDGHDEVFNEWQIAHFRLITDDKKIPYGTSVLDKVRKVFKMLSLAEDAMMVYRISRAPERRVFKIDVGNIDPDDIDAYVSKVANNLKRSPNITTKNGQIDYRYNMLTNDEDYFIPVRNNMNQTVIDTLQGAQNLIDIDDITFLQNKLISGLQIPKSFLGFEETSGDGKTLSMQDIRFARTINKIQQAMIMELNKIAIIHLYLLGFADNISDFKLSLNNPSKQAKILENEILQSKLDNFIKAVTKVDNGFAPMSFTEASKHILGKNDEEIKLSLQQQFIETFEAKNISEDSITSNNYSTGLFDALKKMYKVYDNTKVTNDDDNNSDMNSSDNKLGNTDFDLTSNDDASVPIDGLQERSRMLHEEYKNFTKKNNLLIN